jgi:Protein of unknown function (DUF3562)
VPNPALSTRESLFPDEATVAALAKQTQTPQHIVRRLYDEELAALRANSTVKSYIGVIAGRRVRNHLVALRRK